MKKQTLIKKIKIRNKMGLHIRPATYIVKLLQPCKSNVFFSYKNQSANARSILSLLMLLAKRNAQITITVEGDDAKQTMQLLEKAFEMRFEESL